MYIDVIIAPKKTSIINHFKLSYTRYIELDYSEQLPTLLRAHPVLLHSALQNPCILEEMLYSVVTKSLLYSLWLHKDDFYIQFKAICIFSMFLVFETTKRFC